MSSSVQMANVIHFKVGVDVCFEICPVFVTQSPVVFTLSQPEHFVSYADICIDIGIFRRL